MLAIFGALLSGWLPAMAATMHVAQPAGMHAMHETATHETTGKDAGGEHGKGQKPAVHPVACSACFAIEAERLEPAGRVAVRSERSPAIVSALAGLQLRPLDPPPRS